MQGGASYIRPLTAMRSKAYRAGYDDVYHGATPRFDRWGLGNLLYELGRQTAAYAIGEGIPRIDLPKGRLPESEARLLFRLHVDRRLATGGAA